MTTDPALRAHLVRRYGRKVHMLAAPRIGLVINSEGATPTLLSDRIANGDAFAGEHIVRVPVLAWYAIHARRYGPGVASVAG